MTEQTEHDGEPLRVGFIGAGLVVQAIHLPTLARLPREFRVVKVQGRRAESAALAAGRVGAAWTTSVDEVLADPEIDVIAVCSPREMHAEHVIAALRAGKKAVLCEKPLAADVEGARRIAEESRRLGVPVIVGAMHVHDEAWRDGGLQARFASTPTLVRSTIVLPSTGTLVGLSTQFRPPQAAAPGDEPPTVEAASRAGEQDAASVRLAVLELAVHALPMVRRFLPAWRDVEVISAAPIAPFGYDIALRAGDQLATLVSVSHGHWRSRWELEVVGGDDLLRFDFEPAWVHAGSGTAVHRDRSATVSSVGPVDSDGYDDEWRAILRAVRDGDPMTAELDDAVDDLAFAIAVADRSAQYVMHATEQEREVAAR